MLAPGTSSVLWNFISSGYCRRNVTHALLHAFMQSKAIRKAATWHLSEAIYFTIIFREKGKLTELWLVSYIDRILERRSNAWIVHLHAFANCLGIFWCFHASDEASPAEIEGFVVVSCKVWLVPQNLSTSHC